MSERAVPYGCPFCLEETLHPLPAGRWHCRSCLRAFSLTFYGVHSLQAAENLPADPSPKKKAH